MDELIFVTHPEVVVDPARQVTDWSLSEVGRARARDFAASQTMSKVTAIWASKERKAQETAEILANARDLPVHLDALLGENDRSATGFLPPQDFEAAADAFFDAPDTSFRGWERAVDAQSRIETAVRSIASNHNAAGDLMIVSHGAVGALLYCALKGVAIDRQFDQPSQGHFWTATLIDFSLQHGWKPMA